VSRALHHLDLWVDDVEVVEGEWGGAAPTHHGVVAGTTRGV